MAAPPTVGAAGYFAATRAGHSIGEAVLRIVDAAKGTLEIAGQHWKLTGDPAKKTFSGKKGSSALALKIINRSRLVGTVGSDSLELIRAVLRPIPASELATSDAGPTGSIKAIMDATPDYQTEVGDTTTFWYAFGPVLYRGRLDGTARVLCIASDPGPTECLPFIRRTLVGDSGQKAQGFLAKLGLTRSYVLVNAFAVAMKPSEKSKGMKVLKANAAIKAARHALYNALLGIDLEVIVDFGEEAHTAYDMWAASNPAVKEIPRVKLPHPAAVDRDGSGNDTALKEWTKAIKTLRGIVLPDVDGDATIPNYGAFFTEMDYARIPRWDLPAAAPRYAGDDSSGRGATPRHNNCCERPSPDDGKSLLLSPAPDQGVFLQYSYKNRKLIGARRKDGKKVAIDASGIPI